LYVLHTDLGIFNCRNVPTLPENGGNPETKLYISIYDFDVKNGGPGKKVSINLNYDVPGIRTDRELNAPLAFQ
jgi:hypothetical protein